MWYWRDGVGIETTGYSSRGLRFDSQHPNWWPTTICNSRLRKSNALFQPLCVTDGHMVQRHKCRKSKHIKLINSLL